jgi:hypothetical protein
MEKVLQILLVFGLLMLLIWRSIRPREEGFRRFSYLERWRPPLSEEVRMRLITGRFGLSQEAERALPGVPDNADAYLWDEDSGLMLCYFAEGKLTIYLRSGHALRELQELSVPMDCTGMAWDAQERKVYLEEDGDWFVYAEER